MIQENEKINNIFLENKGINSKRSFRAPEASRVKKERFWLEKG